MRGNTGAATWRRAIGATLVVVATLAVTSPAGFGAARGTSGRAVPAAGASTKACGVNRKLIPDCGILWGAAAGGHTGIPTTTAVHSFETLTQRTQSVFHTYQRGTGTLFPTPEEIALAKEPGHPRIPFINWKPAEASWASIARGNAKIDAFLDNLAAYIKKNYPYRFFMTVQHEPENDVVQRAGSGYTASDYAAMYRHVVQRLRAKGATNIIYVICYMGNRAWGSVPWHDQLYPGNDIIDWIGDDCYGRSTPGYGYGDFNELVNRGKTADGTTWPGFYNWASKKFPGKPLMMSEWGVFTGTDVNHKAAFYNNVGTEISAFPRFKALFYFETPQGKGDTRVNVPANALGPYRRLGKMARFQVDMGNATHKVILGRG